MMRENVGLVTSGDVRRHPTERVPSRRVTDTCVAMTIVAAVFLALAAAVAHAEERMTPLLLAVHDAPMPFRGSDGRTHLVYELWITNFSSGEATVQDVDVLGDGTPLSAIDAAAVATRLQPAGRRDASPTIAPSGTSLLFVHVTLPDGAKAPARLSHVVHANVAAAPPGMQQMTIDGGDVAIDRHLPVVVGSPLRGDRYVAADSCCDATRHTRAALPVDGRARLAQRYAVDWEQLDDASRIYAGPRDQPSSYTIYGKEALAVTDARVASTVDGMPEQTPGAYPTNIPIAQADGNCVILDLGGGRYALYAHLQPGTIRVQRGDRVRRGQVLGLVGNSGNTVAPHLHFHVMDGPSPLASNGLPYEIDAFEVDGHSPGTAAFDVAEEKGTPLEITPVTPPAAVRNALPLDQSIIGFRR
jgi:hypothetical protein